MQRRYRITVFIVLLLGISLGYALLTTNLNILGVSEILNPTWDIHFENVSVKSGSVTAPTPTIDTDQTTVSYSVTLNTPGDYFEFTVDAVNAGTIDGMITEISSTLNNVEIEDNLPSALEYSITYADGVKLAEHQLLASGESETYRVRVGYKTDIDASDLPSTEQTLNLTFTITYQQADENALTVERPTIKKYNSSTSTDIKSSTYRFKIKTITLGDIINPPADVIDSWDIGVDKNGNVMAYITQNPEDNTKYDLYIQGNGYLFANEDSSYLFSDLRGVETINNLSVLNTSKTTNMSFMFRTVGFNASSLNIDVSSFDTSKVSNMSSMFENSGIDVLDLSSWDTSSVTDMSSMFRDVGGSGSDSILDLNLSGWNTSSVTNMRCMFYNFAHGTPTWSIKGISNFYTSNVTDMSYMFYHFGSGSTIVDLNLSSWDTSKVTNMIQMFNETGKNSPTINIDLSGWDVSSVTDMSNMFNYVGYKATTFSLEGLSNWKPSSVTTMSSMFHYFGYKSATINLDLSGWDVSSVTNMSSMFSFMGYSATEWSIGDLSNWNTSSVTNMSSMFYQAGYSASTWNSIGTLNVYATDIGSMFNGCKNANATIIIMNQPTSFRNTFNSASTVSGSRITVNYTSDVTNIDNIIATKSSNSNVIKGSLISYTSFFLDPIDVGA